MTTTAHEDQFTPATQTVVVVREAYDAVAILRRNIAALEVALRQQTERAEAAEAELARLAQQKPVAWRHENGNIFLPWQKDLITTNAVFSPLYAAHVPAPAVLSVSSNVLEMLDGVFADTATGQKYLSEARALLQSAPQASAVQLVDGSDDYYDYLGALVEQHPAGVMRRNTDDKAPAVPDDTAILDWLEMQRVDVASVVGHRPQYGFLSVGASGKSDLRSKVIALLQSEVRHD